MPIYTPAYQYLNISSSSLAQWFPAFASRFSTSSHINPAIQDHWSYSTLHSTIVHDTDDERHEFLGYVVIFIYRDKSLFICNSWWVTWVRYYFRNILWNGPTSTCKITIRSAKMFFLVASTHVVWTWSLWWRKMALLNLAAKIVACCIAGTFWTHTRIHEHAKPELKKILRTSKQMHRTPEISNETALHTTRAMAISGDKNPFVGVGEMCWALLGGRWRRLWANSEEEGDYELHDSSSCLF